MQEPGWITLMDYSTKYQISLSTLRRRIKNHQLKHQLKAGKYLLLDQPLDNHEEVELAIQEPQTTPQEGNIYLQEIKKAYTMILQEKEEQIQILKDEVADLKTLVNVLESENQRLNNHLKARNNN